MEELYLSKELRTDYQYRKVMASTIREATAVMVSEGAKHWIGADYQEDMWKMIKTDADDLLIVANFIDIDPGYHRIPQAYLHAANLDTAVRDVIDNDVWEWLKKVHKKYQKSDDDYWAQLDDGAKYNA